MIVTRTESEGIEEKVHITEEIWASVLKETKIVRGF
jgi:hypothetical protein